MIWSSKVLSFSPLRNHCFIQCKRNLKINAGNSLILDPVRVRFAPSPTGSLHVGGARTALFNWLLAKKTKGEFIIRVEDTDEARSTRESENSILGDLKWLDLNWSEGPDVGGPYGPYRQSERKEIYKTVAEKFIQEGKAYRCFCTEEELEQMKKEAEEKGQISKYSGKWRDADPSLVKQMYENGTPYTIRFKVPKGKIVSIDDVVRGRVTWDADAMLGDFIILRSNGMPVYNFCVSVDDSLMKITHVIRAEEHLSNTLRQMLILEAMGSTPPTYAHCSLILGEDRSKLSKRHGATSVSQFKEAGYLPTAMINYLANLGWNDGTNKEIYSPEELSKAFSMDRIVKGAAVFDLAKLKWINGQHIRLLPLKELEPVVLNSLTNSSLPLFLINQESLPEFRKIDSFDSFILLATKIAQRDMTLLSEINELIATCLSFDIKKAMIEDKTATEVLNDDFLRVISSLVEDYDNHSLPTGIEDNFNDLWKNYTKSLGNRLKLKGKHFFHPLRFALTGRMSGLDVGDQLKFLSLAEKFVFPDKIVTLKQRIDTLRNLSL